MIRSHLEQSGAEYTFCLHSEVRIYDPSGDSTIPSTSKKRKFEEMEEEAADEPETPVVKSKKPKKELVTEGGWNGNKPDGGRKCPYVEFMMLKVSFLHDL